MDEDPRTRIARAIAEMAEKDDFLGDQEMVGDWVIVVALPNMEVDMPSHSYALYMSTENQPTHITTGLLREGLAFRTWMSHDHGEEG